MWWKIGHSKEGRTSVPSLVSSTNHFVFHLGSADLLFRHLRFGALYQWRLQTHFGLVWFPVSFRDRSCLEALWTFGNAAACLAGLVAQFCMPRCWIILDTIKLFVKHLNGWHLSLPYFTTASLLKPLWSRGQSLPSEKKPVLPSAVQQILHRPVEQESICDVQLSEPGEAKTCRL